MTNLPESLGNLKNLIKLDLKSNQLTNLPESLGNLKNLELLNLVRNQLSNLPESFGNLKNLIKLYLGDNQLSNLPESFGNLINLKYLSIRLNQLSTLPEFFGSLNIERLYLGNNKFSVFPESLCNLKNLRVLYLEGNQLSALPESISNLKNLVDLNLRPIPYSRIYFPESFKLLPSIKRLDGLTIPNNVKKRSDYGRFYYEGEDYKSECPTCNTKYCTEIENGQHECCFCSGLDYENGCYNCRERIGKG